MFTLALPEEKKQGWQISGRLKIPFYPVILFYHYTTQYMYSVQATGCFPK